MVVFLDREQGGRDNIHKQGYKLHSVVTISEVLSVLRSHNRITEEKYRDSMNFIKSTTLLEEPKISLTYFNGNQKNKSLCCCRHY